MSCSGYLICLSVAKMSASLQEDLGLPETSYELCYNSACTLIGQGQLPEAMKKLREAEGKGAQRERLGFRVLQAV